MTRPRSSFDLWLRHHGLAIAYQLTAAAALAEGDPPQTVALLTWEAQRHHNAAWRRNHQPRKGIAA